jgi:hypothetical protein
MPHVPIRLAVKERRAVMRVRANVRKVKVQRRMRRRKMRQMTMPRTVWSVWGGRNTCFM